MIANCVGFLPIHFKMRADTITYLLAGELAVEEMIELMK